jgi:hypothetical protein
MEKAYLSGIDSLLGDGRRFPPVNSPKTTHSGDSLPFFPQKKVFFEIKVLSLHQNRKCPTS